MEGTGGANVDDEFGFKMEGTIVHDELGIEKFKMISKLQKGSFGELYIGSSIDKDNLVAVKVMAREEMATAEAEILQSLSHHNIVKFHSFFMDHDHAYISMELAKQSLACVQKVRGRFSDTECRVFFRDIIKGLLYLELHLIVHRDIKPQNLLLSWQNHIMICDFGIAVKLTSKDQLIQGYAGTRLYIASEVIRGEKYSFAVDRFGAGVSLYELLIGKPAFDFHKPQPPTDLLRKYIALGKHCPLPPFCSPSGGAVAKQLMHPDPKERISCEDVLRSSFLQDFYIPENLPHVIVNVIPSYYLFTRENLNTCRLYMHSIHIELQRVLAKGISVGTEVADFESSVKMSTLVFVHNIVYRDKGLGYHLTTGKFGFFFRQDNTLIIETSTHDDSLQYIYIDKEQNGRIVNDSTASGSVLEKLIFFKITRERKEGPSKIQAKTSKRDKFDRVWKLYGNKEKIVFGITNGIIQIIDLLNNVTFLLTVDHFIVATKGNSLGCAYTWESLATNSLMMHQNLHSQLVQSLTDLENFIKQ